LRRFIKSFHHAWDGVTYLFETQKNFKIHLVFTLATVAAAALLGFSFLEWAVLFVVIGLVLCAEAFNTAIERTVDCACPEYSEHAKHAKDSAAAAVLLMSFAAVLVGIVLFGSKLIALIL